MARTDIHRTSEVNPADYDYVTVQYYGPNEQLQDYFRDRINRHMSQTGGTWSDHEHGGDCHICGARFIYGVVFYHHPSNSYIVTGGDCAEKMQMLKAGDKRSMQRSLKELKGKVSRHKRVSRGIDFVKATLETRDKSHLWEMYELLKPITDVSVNKSTLEGEHAIRVALHMCNVPSDDMGMQQLQKAENLLMPDVSLFRNIISECINMSSMSDRQLEFLGTLLERITSRWEKEEEKRLAREAKRRKGVQCPKGRIQLTGKVLSTKVTDTQFGPVTKMLLEEERGFRVWGTASGDAKRGDTVTFRGTVTPSVDDDLFGFFSRPYGLEVVEPAAT